MVAAMAGQKRHSGHLKHQVEAQHLLMKCRDLARSLTFNTTCPIRSGFIIGLSPCLFSKRVNVAPSLWPRSVKAIALLKPQALGFWSGAEGATHRRPSAKWPIASSAPDLVVCVNLTQRS